MQAERTVDLLRRAQKLVDEARSDGSTDTRVIDAFDCLVVHAFEGMLDGRCGEILDCLRAVALDVDEDDCPTRPDCRTPNPYRRTSGHTWKNTDVLAALAEGKKS